MIALNAGSLNLMENELIKIISCYFRPTTTPSSITETIFDVIPQVRAEDVNLLERLWAYLTIQDLLKKVARGGDDLMRGHVRAGTGSPSKRPQETEVCKQPATFGWRRLSRWCRGIRCASLHLVSVRIIRMSNLLSGRLMWWTDI